MFVDVFPVLLRKRRRIMIAGTIRVFEDVQLTTTNENDAPANDLSGV